MSVLVVIGTVWPEPGSSAAGRHMLEILRVFVEADWQVIFATPAEDSLQRADLGDLGIREQTIRLNCDSFDEWLAGVKPDVVLFDRYFIEEQFSWRVARSCPHALRLLDTEDLHFLRHARQQVVRQGLSLQDAALDNEVAVREIASILRSDLSLVISSFEQQLLISRFAVPAQLLHYFPLLVDCPLPAVPGLQQRHDLLFVGTARHAPNRDAVRYLRSKLWPQIHAQLPQARMLVAGSYPTEAILQMHDPDAGFHVLGHVRDLSSLLSSARVYLAPLRFGAGLKGKLLEAMAWGIPVVTTPVGAEGIAAGDAWPGMLGDDDAALVDASVSLYQQKALWQQARENAFSLLQRHFCYHRHAPLLLQRVQQLCGNLAQHRQQNFHGRMLNHHLLRAHEYLSRWIDCKNRH